MPDVTLKLGTQTVALTIDGTPATVRLGENTELAAREADRAEAAADTAEAAAAEATEDAVAAAGPAVAAAVASVVASLESTVSTVTEAQIATQPTGVGEGGGPYVFMLDSLSDGAGGTLRTPFAKIARGALGDGGPGWRPFDNASAVYYTDSFAKTGFTYIAIDDGVYGAYSPDGKGVYTTSAAGTEALTYIPDAWTTATLVYQKGPGFGTFKYKLSTQDNSFLVDVDCDAASLEMGFIEIELAAGAPSTGLVINNFSAGDAFAIYGIDFKLNDTGYRPFNLSLGGRKLQDVAAQDSDHRQAFWAYFTPRQAFLNGGMNDRLTRTGAQHYADWEAIVDDIQAASPTTGIVMVQSLESADYSSSNLDDYVAQKIAITQDKGLAYLDLRKTLGNYAQASAAGFMTDAIHPSNATANPIIAKLYADAVGLPFGLTDPGATAWGGSGGGGEVSTGSLTPVEQLLTTAATRSVLWTLGLTNGNAIVGFEFDVWANRNGTAGCVRKTATIALRNPSGVVDRADICKVGDTPTVVAEYEVTPGDGLSNTVTIDVTISGNLAEVGVTATYASNVTATANWRAMLLSTTDGPVFEH